ncbi:hypothetical protein RHCRD62_60248 [Rhodococcus sp. RD6.2]|nr:hypothetical protein RHCRD62_60248 [Rhodococcus sp. RD6.2]
MASAPSSGEVRQAAGLLPLRGHGRKSVGRADRHRRDHVRADADVGSGVRRRLRGVAEEERARRGRHRPRLPRARIQGRLTFDHVIFTTITVAAALVVENA